MRLQRLVAERGFVRVIDASEELRVSEVTIRADLDILERDGFVTRVHGGAMPKGIGEKESSLETSLVTAPLIKEAIGRAAADMVQPGQSVLLDVGSTTLAVAEALVDRRELSDVVIVTNGLSIALALEAAMPRFTVMVTGGTLRPLQHSLVNPWATPFLESFRADVAFIGCNGVDARGGVTNVNVPEAEVKRQLLRSSARHIVVADASKLGIVDFGSVGPLSEFDTLVTAGEPRDGVLDELRTAGLEIVRASSARR